MTNSRVQKAIDAAIAQAKKHTKRRRAFSKDLLELGARKTKQKRAIDMLSKLGLDLEHLAKEAAKQRKRFASGLRELNRDAKNKPGKRKLPAAFYNTVPPPADTTPNFPFCIFPADDCSYSSPDPTFFHTCDATKAEMSLWLSSTDVGGLLGIEATPWIPPVTGSLWYGIMPPIGGTLAVIAEVLVSGYMYADAETYSDILDLLPSIRADERATLVVRTHQDGGTGVQAASQVIGEAHCDGGSSDGHRWVDDLFVNVLYAQVLPGIPVAIEVSIELEGQGRSTYGYCDIYLRSVTVPALCLNLTPTVIL